MLKTPNYGLQKRVMKQKPSQKVQTKMFFHQTFFFRGIVFFLYKSILSPIVVGFEPLETWGIDGGIQGFNYFVEWTDRMPIHAHFTF